MQDQLLESQQRRVHREAADWLEKAYGCRPTVASARLARHHEQARQPRQALQHMDHAAVWAMAHFAQSEAESWCRRAILVEAELGLQSDTHLRLARHEVLGRVLKGKGNLAEARAHLDTALGLATGLGDEESKAHILWSLAMVAELNSEYADSIRAYKDARQLAERVGAGWPHLRSSLYLSRLQFRSGAIADSVDSWRQALDKEALWGHLPEAASFHTWAMTLMLMSRSNGDAIRIAVQKLEDQMPGLRGRQDWSNLCNVLGFLGNACNLVGEPARARDYFSESLNVAIRNQHG